MGRRPRRAAGRLPGLAPPSPARFERKLVDYFVVVGSSFQLRKWQGEPASNQTHRRQVGMPRELLPRQGGIGRYTCSPLKHCAERVCRWGLQDFDSFQECHWPFPAPSPLAPPQRCRHGEPGKPKLGYDVLAYPSALFAAAHSQNEGHAQPIPQPAMQQPVQVTMQPLSQSEQPPVPLRWREALHNLEARRAL